MTRLKKWIVLYDAVRLSLKKRGKSEFSKPGGCCVRVYTNKHRSTKNLMCYTVNLNLSKKRNEGKLK